MTERTPYSEHVQEERQQELKEQYNNTVANTIEEANRALVDGDVDRVMFCTLYLYELLDMWPYMTHAQREVQDSDLGVEWHHTELYQVKSAWSDVFRAWNSGEYRPTVDARNQPVAAAQRLHKRGHNACRRAWKQIPKYQRGKSVKRALESLENVAAVRELVPTDMTDTYVVEQSE